MDAGSIDVPDPNYETVPNGSLHSALHRGTRWLRVGLGGADAASQLLNTDARCSGERVEQPTRRGCGRCGERHPCRRSGRQQEGDNFLRSEAEHGVPARRGQPIATGSPDVGVDRNTGGALTTTGARRRNSSLMA